MKNDHASRSTPKQRVLRCYSQAVCIPWTADDRAFLIAKTTAPAIQELGHGRTPQKAWANAARKL